MTSPKKPFVDDITVVPGEFLTSVYGGDDSKPDDDPRSHGHFHDDGTTWGHAPKVDLTNHVTGRLTLPTPELKTIRLSAAQAIPLTSSLFWTVPIPSDAYSVSPEPMYLNMYWSANGSISPGNAAFRIDWTYLQLGQNVMPPSVIDRGSSAWPANTLSGNNALPTTFRFKSNVAASVLNVNDPNTPNTGKFIQLSLPSNVPSATLGQFKLLCLEISSAPTVTLFQPMSLVNVFAVDLSYYSSTLGVSNVAPSLLPNDPGLADF